MYKLPNLERHLIFWYAANLEEMHAYHVFLI